MTKLKKSCKKYISKFHNFTNKIFLIYFVNSFRKNTKYYYLQIKKKFMWFSHACFQRVKMASV